MGRRSSVGWFVALTVLVGLGLVIFVAVPLRTCPTCRGLAKKLAGPNGSVGFRIDCPECADRGTVTQLRHWKGSLLSPQVSRLLQAQRESGKLDFGRSLEQVVVLAGKNPDEIFGFKFFESYFWAKAMFRRGGGQDYVLVQLEDDGRSVPGDSSVGLILLSLDGRVLDVLQATCNGRWGSLQPLTVDNPSPEGALVVIHAVGPTDDLNRAMIRVRLGGAAWDFPGAAARARYGVGLKNDRFVILGE